MGKRYVVRFVRIDNEPIEEYYYNTKEEANKHIDLFTGDDSGLYKFIALLDTATNYVTRILVFENGVVREDLQDKDVVRLREGYRSAGEERLLFSVTNINENTGRCLIIYLDGAGAIKHSESVGLETINRVIGIEDILQG